VIRSGASSWWRTATATAAICLAWAGLGSTVQPSAQESQTERTTNDGVYVAEQANEGRTLFRDVCIVCHPDPFWRTSWEGRPLSELYEKILKFMPDDNPGTLSPREVTGALAYILEGSGAPAGRSPLPPDQQALARIRIGHPPK
jgi:hypothetical protein